MAIGAQQSKQKAALRRSVIARVRALPVADRVAEEIRLVARIERLIEAIDAEVLLLFVSHLPEEIETRGLLHRALRRGLTLACPRVDRASKSLRLHRVASIDDDLTPGPFGIPEPDAGAMEIAPAAVDWALVPGVAFDDRGRRLGRGAGFYDRLLPEIRPEAPRVAMALGPQWVAEVPVGPLDRPVDAVVGASRAWERSPGLLLGV